MGTGSFLPGLLWSANIYFLLAMFSPALLATVATELGKIDQLIWLP
jgi:hypothetical protein